MKMPVLFVGHGSPMNAIEENQFTEGWKNIASSIPKPSSILCISAHWETNGTSVSAMDQPETIHDFSGFPPELYNITYPAPGNPELASEIKRSVRSASVGLDFNWGLDHGCWCVVRHMYPGADVPVIQLSLDYSKPPQLHYNLAGELKELRNKGVLIIGSGNMVHNLRMVAWDKMNEPEYGYDWALEAGNKMKDFISSGDHLSLIDYKSQGKAFSLAVPTPEHFLPLLYILALQDKDDSITFFNDKAVMGSLTMTCLKIGES